ncbi:hypothetical protein CPAR01_05374, partial [Colletotrichum paranaense]
IATKINSAPTQRITRGYVRFTPGPSYGDATSALKKIPRYLFRVHAPSTSGKTSLKSIVSRAALCGHARSDCDIFSMPRTKQPRCSTATFAVRLGMVTTSCLGRAHYFSPFNTHCIAASCPKASRPMFRFTHAGDEGRLQLCQLHCAGMFRSGRRMGTSNDSRITLSAEATDKRCCNH